MISIIIPVYKVEAYIDKCIESVLNQSFQDWELILVDDGSPDRCGEMCDNFSKKDPRIKVIHQQNAGLSAARNAGMKVISGDYVTFIDSDDYIAPNHLCSLFNTIKEHNTDISIAGYSLIDDHSIISEKAKKLPTAAVSGRDACIRLMRFDETIMISAWGKLYSKKLFHLIQYPEGRINEDEYVTYRLLYEANNVSFINIDTYKYLKRQDSITAKFTSKHLDVVDAFNDAIDYFVEKNDYELVNLAKKRYLLLLRILYIKSRYLSKSEQNGILVKWKDAYREYRGEISKTSTVIEKVLNILFYLAPHVYARFGKM